MKRARKELTNMRVVIAESYEEKEPLTQYQKDSCKCFWEYGKHIDEHLQALEIIVNKNVDTWAIAHRNLQDYKDIVIPTAELNQEEYDLVSKVVKEIEDEKN